MKASIIFSSYNRGYLLDRSLECYKNQEMPVSDFEIICIDDWSTDDTQEVVEKHSKDLNLVYMKPSYKQPGTWRDGSCLVNMGIRASQGELILAGHPEILVNKKTLTEMYKHVNTAEYIAAKCFYMKASWMDIMDDYDWKSDVNNLQKIPGFFTNDSTEVNGHPDYTTKATLKHQVWESQIFSGGSRAFWKRLGGLQTYEMWGSTDPDQVARRSLLGIKNITVLDPQSITYHCNHDFPPGTNKEHFVASPRDMNLCMRSIKPYTVETASLDYVWK